ncbi:RNA recognition motif domain protein [Apiospora sp. TS-2023a]
MATEAPPSLSFPIDPQEFDSDERISFSRTDNKFIAVQDDGTEFEFDSQLKRWIPIFDEELIAQQQQAYGVNADPADDETTAQVSRKRKNGGGKSDRPPKKPRQNTAVYVTGLPLDVTIDEVHDAFSRKCGVVAEEIDSGRPRIKLYTDDSGNFKGDALVVFFKPQSVEMAIMLLDDTDFRYSASGLPSGKMRVQAADSSYKKTQQETDAEKDAKAAAKETDKVVLTKPRDRTREQDKQKIIKKTQKLDAKLADWDDDGPYAGQLETNVRKERLVILRHMFTLQELEEDPAALLDIKEDIREECARLGQVTNVVLYDLEEDGVVSVKFKTPEAAEACVEMMDGRAFDGRTVRATVASGRERFRRSGKGQDDEAAAADA